LKPTIFGSSSTACAELIIHNSGNAAIHVLMRASLCPAMLPVLPDQRNASGQPDEQPPQSSVIG
jgi:hypothetical protein